MGSHSGEKETFFYPPPTFPPLHPTPLKEKQHWMAPGPNRTDITLLGRNKKHLPMIPRGQNIRGNMDILTNQKAVEHCLGYMELQEPYSTRHKCPPQTGILSLINTRISLKSNTGIIRLPKIFHFPFKINIYAPLSRPVHQ